MNAGSLSFPYLRKTLGTQYSGKLPENEAELQAIFHQAAVGMNLATLDGRFLKVNQKLCDFLAYSKQEILNKTLMDLVHSEDRHVYINELPKLLAGEVETFAIEQRFLQKDGSIFWINLTLSLIRDVNAQPLYIVGVFEDIRDRKRAEEELKRQLVAVEAAIDGIAILRGNTFTYVNKAHVETFGYASADELVGKTWHILYEQEEIHRFEKMVFPFLEQYKHWRGQATAKRKDGTSFAEEVSLILSEQGDLICVCRDISDQKYAEQLLEEQKTFLRSIIDNNPNHIFVKDTSGRYVLVNKALADFYNTSTKELIGKTDAAFHSELELKQFRESDQAVLSQLQPIQILELSIQSLTGKECYFQTTKVPLIAPNGRARGILGVATDITERKLTQDALQQQIERERLFNAITQRIRESLDLQEILNVTVAEIHELLKVDRVLIYRILTETKGKVIAEAVTPEYKSLLNYSLPPRVFPDSNNESYLQGKVAAFSDTHLPEYPDSFKQSMSGRQIRAKLVIPIVQQGVLWGFLITHQCSGPREWKSGEIELLRQLANQLAIAIQQSELYAQLQIELNERKQAETELRQVKERLQFLIDSSPAVIFSVKHPEYYQLTYISENVHNLTGFSAEEFLNDPLLWLNRIHPDDASQLLANFPQRLTRGSQVSEYRWRHRDGKYRWMLGETKTIRDQYGNVVDIVGLWIDISAHKKAEEEILTNLEKEKELNDLKSRFISMTSHEFRTPLAVIASSAGILKSFSHRLSEEQKQKHLQCIQTYVQHTTQLLDDILLINKAEAGKLAFEPSSLNLMSFCCTLVEEIQLSAPNHKLVYSCKNLQNSANPECSIAYMDKKLLRQILSNLLTNAVKYSPEQSQVNFELIIKDEIGVFLVQDEGIGISPEDQQHLFESFYRGSNVGNMQGTGLGLTIVKKCVDLHGGRIMVSSQVGMGTTFKVELPLISNFAMQSE